MGEQTLAREAFAKAMMLLATSLHFDLDTAVLGVYWKALGDLSPEIRREAFLRASTVRWFKFPQPGQLLSLANDVLTEKRLEASKRHLADCTHSGYWLTDEQGNVTGRCPCFQRSVQAMEQVGRLIPMPALPSYGETEYE